MYFPLKLKKKPKHKVYASTLERRERRCLTTQDDDGDLKMTPLMADEFECEVGAGEECAKMMKVINSNVRVHEGFVLCHMCMYLC